MDFWTQLLHVTMLLAGALALGILMERVRQSAIVGYLLIGVLLGPGFLNWIEKSQAVESLAEIGVALLLFTIGLEFSWAQLRRMGAVIGLGGVLQISMTAVVFAVFAAYAGMPWRSALLWGVMISVSSTACLTRLLASRGEIDSVHGRHAMGLALMQDAALVPMVLLVTLLSGQGTVWESMLAMAMVVLKAGAMIAGFVLLSSYGLPRLLDAAALSKNRELPVLLATVTCLGAAWAAHSLGLSPALGAFLAGMLLGESPFAVQIRADVSSLKTLFVTLFFTSIGMLAEPAWMLEHAGQLALWLVLLVLGKAFLIWAILAAFHVRHAAALTAGFCLAQVGEFAFVLAQIARQGGAFDATAFRGMVSLALLSLLCTPYVIALAPHAGRAFERLLIRLRFAMPPAEVPEELTKGLRNHVILIGYGPAGQGVVDTLRDSGTEVVIVESNPRTVARARQENRIAMVGDATQEEIWHHLHAEAARMVVVSVPDHQAAEQIIRRVRAEAPQVPVIVRSRYHQNAAQLESAGAHVVVDEEQQIGYLLGIEVVRYGWSADDGAAERATE